MNADHDRLSTDRLIELSNEASRIATTLARLSADRSIALKPQLDDGTVPQISPELIHSVVRARRLRGRFFDDSLFADPAWDMFLDLFHSELAGRRVPVSSLCLGAAVPQTTGLRWIKTLVEKGLFVRRNDPFDARRVFIELSGEASIAMRRYFGEVGSVATI